MKLTLLLSVLFAAAVLAGPVQRSLVWDDPNPPGSIKHYTVYSLTPLSTNEVARVQTASWLIKLPTGEHTIAVTATDHVGMESEFSTNLTFRILVMQRNLRIE